MYFRCGIWSIAAFFIRPDTHPERICQEYRDHIQTMDLTGIEYPMKVMDFDTFEKNNPEYSINIFKTVEHSTEEGGRTLSIDYHRNTKVKKKYHVNLLLITDDESGKFHYILITNLSGLLSSQIPRHARKRMILCDLCLRLFKTEQEKFNHIMSKICLATDVILPRGRFKCTDKGNIRIWRGSVKKRRINQSWRKRQQDGNESTI